MENNQLVKLFRYVRPIELDLIRFEIITLPTGGITFYFELDQDKGNLTFSAVICRPDENFNYRISQQIARGRFEAGILWPMSSYDRNLSLVQNVLAELNLYHDALSPPNQTLRSRLNEIITNNTLVINLHKNIIRQVNEKHGRILNGNNLK